MNGKTELFCLIGENTKNSLSPAIHNSAFKRLGINAKYVCFDVKQNDLENAIKGIRALGIKGANITMPYKTKVLNHLDRIEGKAKKIGAVNTIVNKNNMLFGFNTDGTGAVKALEEKTKLKGKTVTLIGCGGAGKAIAFELSKKVDKLNLLSIQPKETAEFAKKLKKIKTKVMQLNNKSLKNALNESDILINASPVGMKPNQTKSLVPKELLYSELTVFDVIYTPVKTKLIRNAEEKRCITVTGDKMLLFQAAESFKYFTGRNAQIKLMQKAVKKQLEVIK
ncbi:shikimate dehydrogenase [Candidatus Micrarchaeota archaeon]|nr:shikimate dehydrogenase [Candidatus Micrarchaeota archaeon]MBU2477349.1 shikimate dehydrogenase [Candidatus Micrarchaeota archaeon]